MSLPSIHWVLQEPHSPVRTAFSASGSLLVVASINAIANSAVVLVNTPGVLLVPCYEAITSVHWACLTPQRSDYLYSTPYRCDRSLHSSY
jgi:hypothetical protein